MFGNYIVRPISPILEVPSSLTPFQNTPVQFYSPFATSNVQTNIKMTHIYNSNGVNVELSGTSDNIKKP